MPSTEHQPFSSVARLCPTLCDPTDRSTPGLPVHHQLPEPAQTHVCQVTDAIQPSHPLPSPSPPAFNLSQHQGVFQWLGSWQPVAKVLELQSPLNIPTFLSYFYPLPILSPLDFQNVFLFTLIFLNTTTKFSAFQITITFISKTVKDFDHLASVCLSSVPFRTSQNGPQVILLWFVGVDLQEARCSVKKELDRSYERCNW